MRNPTNSIGTWLTTQETADRTGLSVHAIRKWRTKKYRKRKEYNLRPFKIGNGKKARVFYWSHFVDRWMDQWDLIQQSPE